MRTPYDHYGWLVMAIVALAVLGYSCASAGADAIQAQYDALDSLRAERAERVYGSTYQYEQFKEENK